MLFSFRTTTLSCQPSSALLRRTTEKVIIVLRVIAGDKGNFSLNLSGLDKLLSMANIDVNQTNKHGEGAIHVAAGLGQLDILKMLAAKGGNLGMVDQRYNHLFLSWKVFPIYRQFAEETAPSIGLPGRVEMM